MADKPNIVIIECDSMDGRVMSCMKHLAAYTPNMDQLAERGVLFRNAYCNSPQCCPSRASRWSGKHTHEIEGWNNYKGIEEGEPTYLTDLEAAGYKTKMIGKTDYLSGSHSLGSRVFSWTRAANIHLPQKSPPTVGLKRMQGDVERVHKADWKRVDQSMQWLKSQAGKDGPIFLTCSFSAPHPSFVSSDLYLDKIDIDRVTVPRLEEEMHPVMAYMSATKNCLQEFSDDEILRVRRTYYAMVAEVDAMVGYVFRAIQDLGLGDNTYLIFTSDHGEMNMEHRQYLKNSVYEASARVPMIIMGPDVKEGFAVDDLVSLVDLYPTLMDLAGIKATPKLSGHSLSSFLSGKPKRHPNWVLSQYHSNFSNTGIFMLRQDLWKYVAYPGFEPQLFNFEKDRDELKDLASTSPDVVKKMDKKLRSVLDYEAVDKKAKDYDKESFLAWRQEIGGEYQKTMSKLYHGRWGADEDDQIESWLNAN